MTILAMFHLFSELLAAAPGAAATVEEAVAALHGDGSNAAKTQAVVEAAGRLANAGTQVLANVSPAA